jgi:hypothetical protein
MTSRSREALCLFVMLIAFCAPPAAAQLGDQLSSYTGANAEGYLQPLTDAIGSDLNSGIFRTAHIPKMGPLVRLEIQLMSVLFSDDDKTFNAITEGDFSPQQRVSAPTVVGSEKAVVVEGDGGSQFAFPGGFDLSSFTLAVPQLRIGAVMGSELLLRYFAMQIGDDDLGNISLFGIGARHSITQYLGDKLPLDLAAGFFWQSLKLGEDEQGNDIVSSSAFSIGVQASKEVVKFVVPYGGLSYDMQSTEVTYETDSFGASETIDVDFERVDTARLTLGIMFDLPVLKAFAEYNLASQSSFVLGIGFGYGG